MLGFIEFLSEERRKEVNLDKDLFGELSTEAQRAIESWEYAMWSTGDLENAYKTKNSVYREIEEKADVLRSVIRKANGKNILLYRGAKENSPSDEQAHKGRILYSWTARKNIAALFAGLATSNGGKDVVLNKEKQSSNSFLLGITDREIRKAESELKTKGKSKLKSLYLTTSPFNEDYFEVQIRKGGRLSFFGDDRKDRFFEWLKKQIEDEKKFNKEIQQKGQDSGYVVSEKIPVSDIVWVLNNGKTYPGTLEYIVKGNSCMQSKRVPV